MKKLLVLGGGADQIDLLVDLQKRGYYTILVDYTPNPVAKRYANLHIQVSTLDYDEVERVAKEHDVSCILTVCTDQALMSMAIVSERLGLPCQFTSEQIKCITNKIFMKTVMLDNNIPTAAFKIIHSVDIDFSGLKFPLIVKPADCNSSKGVRKVETIEDAHHYIEDALKLSRTAGAIIEEFKNGVEVSIDAFVYENKVEVIMIGELKKHRMDSNTQIIYQNTIPAQISDISKEKIGGIANDIAKAFGIKNSPLLIQAIVDGDDVFVIEFSSRLGGGCKHHTIKAVTGIDIMQLNIKALLGEPLPSELTFKHQPNIISRLHLYLCPGRLDKVEHIDKLLADSTIIEYIQNKTIGTVFTPAQASTDRLGSLLFCANNLADLQDKIDTAIETISIVSKEGIQMLKKDIYQSVTSDTK